MILTRMPAHLAPSSVIWESIIVLSYFRKNETVVCLFLVTVCVLFPNRVRCQSKLYTLSFQLPLPASWMLRWYGKVFYVLLLWLIFVNLCLLAICLLKEYTFLSSEYLEHKFLNFLVISWHYCRHYFFKEK